MEQNKMSKSDTLVRPTLKTKSLHEDQCEKLSAMSSEDEEDASLSHSFNVDKVNCRGASKIESNNVSDSKDLSEGNILKRNIQDEIDLKNHESVEDMKISDDMTDACKTVCEICHKAFPLSSMRTHTLKVHKVQITEYKQMYGNFNIIEKVFHKCHICGKIVLLDNDHLGGHIKGSHKMKEKEYKDKYMTLAYPKSQPPTIKMVMEDNIEGDANIEGVKSGMKRKLEKNVGSKTLKMSKEKNPTLVPKQKQSSNLSIESGSNPHSVPKKSRKLPSKKLNVGTNIIKEEIKDLHTNKQTEDTCNADFITDNSQDLESNEDVADDITNKVNIEDIASESTDKSKDVSKDNTLAIIDVQKEQPIENLFISRNLEKSPYIIKDVHDKKLIEDICNADFIIDNSQDIESNGYVADDITSKADIVSYSTDKSKNIAKVDNCEWISDCENNELFCNGGPTVKEGWKICFEEWEIDGCKVMLAKYMSPSGVIYTRGEDGYQIPDLE